MYFEVCASLAQTPEIIPAVGILWLGFRGMWNRVVSFYLKGRSWTPESLVRIYKIKPCHIPEVSRLCIFIHLIFTRTWVRAKSAFHIINPYGAASSMNWSAVRRVLPCVCVCMCICVYTHIHTHTHIYIYKIICDQETSTMSRPRAELGYCLIRPHALNTFRIVEVQFSAFVTKELDARAQSSSYSGFFVPGKRRAEWSVGPILSEHAVKGEKPVTPVANRNLAYRRAGGSRSYASHLFY